MMRILITGGGGFIGSKIADNIGNQGHDVIVFDITAKNGISGGVEHIKGDIFDTKHTLEVLDKCDFVIHMVGLPSARKAHEKPQFSFELNVNSVQAILETMRKANVKNFILPSSAAVYGNVSERKGIAENTIPKPMNTYAYHKWIAEEVCKCYMRNYGLKPTILRLFNVYGKQGTGLINILVEKASRSEPIAIFGESQLRDFIHIDDVAMVFSEILGCGNCANQIINVGTGVGRSIKDIVELVFKCSPLFSG